MEIWEVGGDEGRRSHALHECRDLAHFESIFKDIHFPSS